MIRSRSLVVAGALMAILALSSCTGIKRWAYERGDRDTWQHPERVIAELEIVPGQRVADLGSGGGYFTFRLADAVKPDGIVYAVDVDTAMNEDLARRAQARGYQNIEIVQASFEDPKIPGGGVDLIFTSNTYHHITEKRREYFDNARRFLKPGGRIAIIDYKREGFFRRVFGHAMERDVIVSEMESVGYRLESDHSLPKQHFLVFRLKPSGSRASRELEGVPPKGTPGPVGEGQEAGST